jgi:hypothetical protein
MAVWTLQAPMAQLSLPGGASITFEAINPSTGAAVAGVNVTSFTIYGYPGDTGETVLPDVLPVYTPQQSV